MQEIRPLCTKLQSHSTRFKRLQEQFDEFVDRMASVTVDENFPVKGLQWKRLGENSCSTSLAGFTLVLVFNPLVDGDVLKGQIVSYRYIDFPELQHEHLGEFNFLPNGDTTLHDPHGNVVDLVSNAPHIVLDLLHQAIHATDIRQTP